MPSIIPQIESKVVERKDGWHVVSQDGEKHLGGPYRTKAEADKRLRQIEYFKQRDAQARKMKSVGPSMLPMPAPTMPVFGRHEVKAMKEVMIRQKLPRGGGNRLVKADVISENEGTLRLKIQGQNKISEVRSDQTMSAEQIFGRQGSNRVISKQYPRSPFALANRLG